MVAETGPLKGIRVVDMTINMAGPTCSLYLADLGADVIKVERPDRGDDTRRFIPPEIRGESSAFMMMNRNKRGIALDIKSGAGKEVFRRLARSADVLVENFKRDTLERNGLGYPHLSKENPRLIYCSLTGFGRTGPYADRGGLDLVAQGMSGLMSITGEGGGRPPVKVGSPVCDIMGGMFAAMAVLAALCWRQQTGEGQLVDTSLFEAGITSTYHQSAIYVATGKSPGAMGTVHPLNAPYQAFETKDGYITIAAGADERWKRLTDALGIEHLRADPRFKTAPDRVVNVKALQEVLEPIFRQKSRAEWLDLLLAADVPAGPILSIGEMHSDPQTVARNMFVEVEHSKVGRVKTLGSPIKMSKTPPNVRRAAPYLGEHTREVLSEIGYSAAEIERLAKDKVVRLG
ncbi:MAG: CoA transferase [Proteobacteria bacterium]|nr:CoA transferase [Pseudomonadota bacterium]